MGEGVASSSWGTVCVGPAKEEGAVLFLYRRIEPKTEGCALLIMMSSVWKETRERAPAERERERERERETRGERER